MISDQKPSAVLVNYDRGSIELFRDGIIAEGRIIRWFCVRSVSMVFKESEGTYASFTIIAWLNDPPDLPKSPTIIEISTQDLGNGELHLLREKIVTAALGKRRTLKEEQPNDSEEELDYE